MPVATGSKPYSRVRCRDRQGSGRSLSTSVILGTVTTTYPSGAYLRRRSRRRIVLAVSAAVVGAALIAGAVVIVAMLLPPGPRPLFQMPVGCGETWQLGTYPGHDAYDVDFFPLQGEPWGQPVLASYAGTVTVSGINGTLGGRVRPSPGLRTCTTSSTGVPFSGWSSTSRTRMRQTSRFGVCLAIPGRRLLTRRDGPPRWTR